MGYKSKKEGFPQEVENAPAVDVIHCAGNHSFILDKYGKIYGTGDNQGGQLGLGDREPRYSFTNVSELKHEHISQIDSGRYHTIALGKDVYSWGSGEDGRLGHGNMKSFLIPKKISYFEGKKVRKIACGGCHSAAIVDEKDL